MPCTTSFPGIDRNPAIMGGRPCIRGKRVTVGMIMGQLGAGRSIDDLLGDYPYLTRAEVLEAVRYAASLCRNSEGIA